MHPLVEDAKTFALEAHGSIGQMYGPHDYGFHLEVVVEQLGDLPFNPHKLAAGWLHDVKEDVPERGTDEILTHRFGGVVAGLVNEVSKVTTPSDGNRARRSALERQHLANVSDDAQDIKLSDTTCHLRFIHLMSPSFARIYVPEKALLLPVLTRGALVMRERAAIALAHAEAYLKGIKA
jgi:(p)ppGpp synthase/HD superfamily hydrolase